MPRSKQRKKIDHGISKEREKDNIDTAKPGEYCYFIDNSKKIVWGQILGIFEENNETIFQVRCMTEWRFYVVSSSFCAFSESALKTAKKK